MKRMAEASFSAYFFLVFERQKQHILAILRKKEKGRNKKDDQIGCAFFGRKVYFFPNFKPIFA